MDENIEQPENGKPSLPQTPGAEVMPSAVPQVDKAVEAEDARLVDDDGGDEQPVQEKAVVAPFAPVLGKIRNLPIEHRNIVDSMIEQGMTAINIVRSIKNLYPKIWAVLGGSLGRDTVRDYRKWYRNKKQALAIIEKGGSIKTRDLMDAITDMAAKGEVDKPILIRSIILMLANKIRAMGEEYDLEARKLLPTYIAEMRMMLELALKMAGELKTDQKTIVVNIVHGYLDGIYKAVYRAILKVCPQYITALSNEIRIQIKSYQDALALQERVSASIQQEKK